MFRIVLQVGNLDLAITTYGKLLGLEGRVIGGGRAYFDAGPMILALLGVDAPAPIPDHLYFATPELDAVYARAKELDLLSKDQVHGAPAGEIVVRPWHERSFYVEDPWGNGLCFVDETTLFTGTR